MQCAISHWHHTIWAHAFNSIKIFTIRRYPALVAVSSGTLLLTAAFAVSMAVLASRYGHERDAAKIERTRAEQVSGFFSEMLTGADPNTAQGRKLTALDLLDSASARISKQLSGQPEVRAQLLETMGDAYNRLGIEDRAEAMFSALIAENGRLHGTAGVPAARAYRERGDVRRMIRDLPGAESDLRFSLAEPEKNSSASANEMPDAVNNLGLVPQAEGKTREARGLFERAVALSRNFPKEPTRTLTLMGNLGGVYIDLALYPEAERILCEVLERRRALLGDNHPRVPNTTMRLGYVLYLRGDYAGAEALYLNAIADLHRIVGTDHPDVIEDGNTLGRLYLETGRKSRSRGALPGCCR